MRPSRKAKERGLRYLERGARGSRNQMNNDYYALQATNGSNNCVICLDEIRTRGVISVCCHWFCFFCIHEWSKKTNTCPLCKAKFRCITKVELGKRSVPVQKFRIKDKEQSMTVIADDDYEVAMGLINESLSDEGTADLDETFEPPTGHSNRHHGRLRVQLRSRRESNEHALRPSSHPYRLRTLDTSVHTEHQSRQHFQSASNIIIQENISITPSVETETQSSETETQSDENETQSDVDQTQFDSLNEAKSDNEENQSDENDSQCHENERHCFQNDSQFDENEAPSEVKVVEQQPEPVRDTKRKNRKKRKRRTLLNYHSPVRTNYRQRQSNLNGWIDMSYKRTTVNLRTRPQRRVLSAPLRSFAGQRQAKLKGISNLARNSLEWSFSRDSSPRPMKSPPMVQNQKRATTNKRKYYFQNENENENESESDVENYDVINREKRKTSSRKRRHLEESGSSSEDDIGSETEYKDQYRLRNSKSRNDKRFANIENHHKSPRINMRCVAMDNSGCSTVFKSYERVSNSQSSSSDEQDESVMNDVLSFTSTTHQKNISENKDCYSSDGKENLISRTNINNKARHVNAQFISLNRAVKPSLHQLENERTSNLPKPVLNALSPELFSSFRASKKTSIEWHATPLNTKSHKNLRDFHNNSSLSIKSDDIFNMNDDYFDEEVSPSVCKSTWHFMQNSSKSRRKTPEQTYSSRLSKKMRTLSTKTNVLERRYCTLRFKADNDLHMATRNTSHSSSTPK